MIVLCWLIYMVTNSSLDLSYAGIIIEDSKDFMTAFVSISTKHIYREVNLLCSS